MDANEITVRFRQGGHDEAAGGERTIKVDDAEIRMSQDYAEIEKSARLLSPEERARLAEAMTESLREAMPADVEAAWEAEIKRRIDAYERGEAHLSPAEDVFAKARKITGG